MGVSDVNVDSINISHFIQQKKEKVDLDKIDLDSNAVALQQVYKDVYRSFLTIASITSSHTSLDSFFSVVQKEITRVYKNSDFSISLLSTPLLCHDCQTDNEVKSLPSFSVDSFLNHKLNTFDFTRLDVAVFELMLTFKKPVLLKNNSVFNLLDDGDVYQYPQIDLSYHPKKTFIISPLFNGDYLLGFSCVAYTALSNGQHDYESLIYSSMLCQSVEQVLFTDSLRQQIQENNEKLEKTIEHRTEALQTFNHKLQMQIDERLKAEARLYHDAHHDTLTQLPNRAMFSDRVTYAIKQLKRHPKHRFAVLFIDLDRFKMINDTLGHHAGDCFLIEIAHRLQVCVRENDVLARLGGDEFVILVDAVQSSDDIEDICLRVIESISQPFDYEGQLLYSNASIGVAQSRLSYNHASEIIRDADAAMYQAKHLGRGRYVFFDDSMREQLLANMTLEQELRLAIKQQQFELHYQKISDLFLNETLGFEVLLRWKHPSKGILSPSDFLYMAEETGMILEIENWVVKEVCRQLSRWNDSDKYSHAYVAINMSGKHLIQPNQLIGLIDEIKKNTIEPERLILEFNEEALVRHKELALKGLLKLKEFGVKLALDDYGTVKSSFNLLHNSPFEFIKLDRSFIKTLNNNDKNLLLVKTLQDLGNNFGYRIVAEGIESEEMLEKLKSVGCEFGQGFYISMPKKLTIEQEKSAIEDKKARA